MMAKRLAIVLAMTATTAVPAFAQEAQVAAHPVGPAEGGQYAPVGPTQQEALPALAPVAGSGQYAPEAAAQGGEDCTLTTYPEQPCPPQEVGVPVDATMPEEVGAVVSGDTNNANGSGRVSRVGAGGNGSVDASGGGAVRGSASSATKVLPATGGVLPIAGLAGLVIVGAGLVVRRESAR